MLAQGLPGITLQRTRSRKFWALERQAFRRGRGERSNAVGFCPTACRADHPACGKSRHPVRHETHPRTEYPEDEMKLAKGLLSFLLAVLAAPLLAVEVPEMNIEHSIVINAPPEAVWEVVGDFNGLPRWLSTITESRIILGKNREVGAIRELRRANGTKVQEKADCLRTLEQVAGVYLYRRPGRRDRLFPDHDGVRCRRRREQSGLEGELQTRCLLDRRTAAGPGRRNAAQHA